MKIYNIGECGLNDYDLKLLDDFEWVVYEYDIDYYEGRGTLIGYKDGQLYEVGLEHCSCYGPTERGASPIPLSYFDDTGSIHDCNKALADKVLELLKGESNDC